MPKTTKQKPTPLTGDDGGFSAETVSLSVREIEIAVLIGEGRTYPEIGDALDMGYETVRTYVTSLRDKTGKRRKVELALWAAENRNWLRREAERKRAEDAS